MDGVEGRAQSWKINFGAVFELSALRIILLGLTAEGAVTCVAVALWLALVYEDGMGIQEVVYLNLIH